MRKQQHGGSTNNNQATVYTSECISSGSLSNAATKTQCSDTRTPDSDCDSERKYPDLLDISSLSNSATSCNSSNNNNSLTKNTNNTSASSAFCTFPRKKHSNGRFIKAASESQSPLLPPDCSSRYGSSSIASDTDVTMSIGRRQSVDSYSNYPLSVYAANKDTGRSSSFLNLTNTSSLTSKSHSLHHTHYRNPSLPSSPNRDSKQIVFSPNATPLLDFATLTARNPVIGTPSPSTSTSASAYDYHAAQLDRFLEEYRNLQEQLCKMKETCDSIRKKDGVVGAAQHQRVSNVMTGQSAKFTDPAMYTAAALTSSGSPTSIFTDDLTTPGTNPKGILKNKSMIPGQPPDPPPYSLHRGWKRLPDPEAADFFQS